ncbi:hypothetical protein ACX6XY_07235 [Streptomyces sp. O3]
MHDRIDAEQREFDEELRGLLAALDELTREQQSPIDLAALLQERLRQAELRAYAKGWQDAEETLRPELQKARAVLASRLRLVHSSDRPADVLPFPRPRPAGDAAARSTERDDVREAVRDDADGPAEVAAAGGVAEGTAQEGSEGDADWSADEPSKAAADADADADAESAAEATAPKRYRRPARRRERTPQGTAEADGDMGPESADAPQPVFDRKNPQSRTPTIPPISRRVPRPRTVADEPPEPKKSCGNQ